MKLGRYEFPAFWSVVGGVITAAILAHNISILLLLGVLPFALASSVRLWARVAARRLPERTPDSPDRGGWAGVAEGDENRRIGFLRSVAPGWSFEQDKTFLMAALGLCIVVYGLYSRGLVGTEAAASSVVLAVPLIAWAAADMVGSRGRQVLVSGVAVLTLAVAVTHVVLRALG